MKIRGGENGEKNSFSDGDNGNSFTKRYGFRVYVI